MTSEIKLLAIDLDGTLLRSDHRLSERNRLAIRGAMQQGVEIVLATGKTRNSALELIEDLDINSPGIFMQGLITYNGDGTVRRRHIMDKQIAQHVFALAELHSFRAIAYSDNRAFSLMPDEVSDRMTEYGEPEAELVASWHEVLNAIDINKIILYDAEDRVAVLREQIRESIGAYVHVTRANIAGMLEVLPGNTSKGQSLKLLLEEMGIEPRNALAIGDGENDIEMLQAVGIGVAMGNAVQLLKDAASEIVPSNDDDGVAHAIEKFVINEKVELQ